MIFSGIINYFSGEIIDFSGKINDISGKINDIFRENNWFFRGNNWFFRENNWFFRKNNWFFRKNNRFFGESKWFNRENNLFFFMEKNDIILAKIIDFWGKTIDFSGKIIDFSGKIIDFSGRIIDFFGKNKWLFRKNNWFFREKYQQEWIKLLFGVIFCICPPIHQKSPLPPKKNIHPWKTESWFVICSDEARSGGEDESAGLRGRGDSVQEELQRGAGKPEQGGVGLQGGAWSFFKSKVGFDTGLYFFTRNYFSSPPFWNSFPQAGVARCGFESIGTSWLLRPGQSFCCSLKLN